MARHGENIRKRKDGRWEGRYLVYSEERGKPQYQSLYGKTYEEVREKLILRKGKVKMPAGKWEETQGQPQKSGEEIPFSHMAREWLLQVKATRKQSTYVKYQFIYQTYLEQSFQDISISMLTDGLVRKRICDPLSESTAKSIYCVLNQILKYSYENYALRISPLKRPVSCTSSKPVEVLSRKEQARLLDVLYHQTDRPKAAVLLCLYTGLRLGEVCALKWEDIDGRNQMITVRRAVQRIYVEGHRTKTILLETAPKSTCSKREIPLPSAIFTILGDFEEKKEYIFGGHKPMEPRTMQNHFKQILAEAGVSDKNFHMLRHTFSTNCIEEGTDVKSLSELLGHSDVQITLNRYVHPSMDTKRKHLDSLSAFYGQIHGQTS